MMCKYLKRTVANTLDFISTWHTHIFAKRKQFGFSLTKIYWLLGRKSKLSTNNKLLIYKVILKPIWTYVIQLWGTTSNSNIEILERFQSKILRLIVDSPWHVSNSFIRKVLQIPTVKEEISRFSSHYDVRISVMNLSPHSPSRCSIGACVDTGHMTCLSDSNNLY
jgi:hypothetical protein